MNISIIHVVVFTIESIVLKICVLEYQSNYNGLSIQTILLVMTKTSTIILLPTIILL